MALLALPWLHASSKNNITFSLSHIDPDNHQIALPFTSPTYTSLSLTTLLHLNKKSSTSSTSPEQHWAQILSSRFIPIHLPVSTLSSAVPPHTLVKVCLSLLLSTCTHLPLPSPSIRFRNILNFELSCASVIHSFFTSHHAQSFNICPIPLTVSPSSFSTTSFVHSNFSKLHCKSSNHFTLPWASHAYIVQPV